MLHDSILAIFRLEAISKIDKSEGTALSFSRKIDSELLWATYLL